MILCKLNEYRRDENLQTVSYNTYFNNTILYGYGSLTVFQLLGEVETKWSYLFSASKC